MLECEEEKQRFCAMIWDFYRTQGRFFPWRAPEAEPYHILVSEVMLQQTQTYRVEPKYETFIATFPTIQALAGAELVDVLRAWQGLGYNRRARMLHEAARVIVAEHAGVIPADQELLDALPGIGKATAASICAFAYNMPTVFIETNVRAVFIHHFFRDDKHVHDDQIMPLVAATLDRQNPREWYYALMDYGVMLKKLLPNPARKSAHYARQSRFEGSDRQIRGGLIRFILQNKKVTLAACVRVLGAEKARVKRIADQLIVEGLLATCGRCLVIANAKSA